MKLSRELMMRIVEEELSRHTRPPIQKKDKLAEKIVDRLVAAQDKTDPVAKAANDELAAALARKR